MVVKACSGDNGEGGAWRVKWTDASGKEEFYFASSSALKIFTAKAVLLGDVRKGPYGCEFLCRI